eukprot:TRINITY_DN56745_c0_g1_i1.p1 TRINITY_DN56745_c0_g1~~TRINITY_DN56745_c0_g1_i1.p1  ORF type:complete len:196 (-),score=21.12 TRINITY_DN56745_c0_g1_i1:9-596(-)
MVPLPADLHPIRQPPRFGGKCSGEFSKSGILRQRDLDIGGVNRAFQPDRNFTRLRRCTDAVRPARGAPGGAFKEPSVQLCKQRHQEWLERHEEQRSKHVNALYFQSRRRDQIRKELDGVEYQLQGTWHKEPSEIAELEDSKCRLKLALKRAESAPMLQTRPPTPKGQAKHLLGWHCQKKSSGLFNSTGSGGLQVS